MRPHLTDAQLRVLREVSAGQTNRQIGRRLHLSPWTVKMHLDRLRVALGARDRAHAVALGYELGWLP